LSRIIKAESNSTQRKRILEGIAAALRFAAQNQPDEHDVRDILAFLLLSLRSIAELNETTVLAWEKRGYWVKADRYRMQWAWVQQALTELNTSVSGGDMQSGILTAAKLAQHVSDIQLSARKRNMKPWINAWDEWRRGGN